MAPKRTRGRSRRSVEELRAKREKWNDPEWKALRSTNLSQHVLKSMRNIPELLSDRVKTHQAERLRDHVAFGGLGFHPTRSCVYCSYETRNENGSLIRASVFPGEKPRKTTFGCTKCLVPLCRLSRTAENPKSCYEKWHEDRDIPIDSSCTFSAEDEPKFEINAEQQFDLVIQPVDSP